MCFFVQIGIARMYRSIVRLLPKTNSPNGKRGIAQAINDRQCIPKRIPELRHLLRIDGPHKTIGWSKRVECLQYTVSLSDNDGSFSHSFARCDLCIENNMWRVRYSLGPFCPERRSYIIHRWDDLHATVLCLTKCI